MKAKIMGFGLLVSLAGANAWALEKEVNIGVKGMVCAFCAQGIEKKFHAQPAVEQVKVSLGKKKVSLTLKDGRGISDDAIKNILTESGYNVETIERN